MLLLVFTLFSCSSGTDTLKIATAANMQFAMEELIGAFEEETEFQAEMILSSSGKLTAQIEAGAPFDIFFSADEKYPKQLWDKGLTDEPSIYAYGRLVEWKVERDQYQLYAMANPKTAPYGRATEEYLKNQKIQLPDVVYGESISQVNQFLLSGTVDAGFTSLSTVLSNKFHRAGSWQIIPDSLHSPIAQSYAIIKGSEKKDKATAFSSFLSSNNAKAILEAYGYHVN